MAGRKYIIITPARNEAEFIERTLDAVMRQSEPPAEWIIVDDGSTDQTREIVARYSDRPTPPRLIKKADRGDDAVGAGVVEAFNQGLANIQTEDYDYLVKLDADIDLPEDYFERLLNAFEEEPTYGIISGQNYIPRGDKLVIEKHADFHPVGGARIYSRRCFEQIGGLVQAPGWDTLDLIRAALAGNKTANFDDLKVIHLRDMSTRKGHAEGIRRLGRISYLLGYHPLYFTLRLIYRLADRPFILRSFYLAAGYLSAWLARESRIVNDAERDYLRRLQLSRIGLASPPVVGSKSESVE